MRESFCALTFYSTHLALRFEATVKKQKINARLIPVPRQISSSCGLAARFECEDLEEIKRVCQEENIEHENTYRVFANGNAEEIH